MSFTPPGKLNKLIVLGDGTPDDFALLLISHHLNGNDSVGIVKPETTGISIFGSIRTYLSMPEYGPLRKMLFILDPEERAADSIFEEFEKRVKKANIEFSCRKESSGGQLRIYDCNLGSRQFNVMLVLNGLPGIKSPKHTIEDHFLKVTSELGLINLPEKIDDPKHWWQTKVDTQTQEAVFKRLAESRKLTEATFPQQMEGCKFLKA